MAKFNLVFDTQQLFRSVLESMSYVGSVKNVASICSECDYRIDLYKITQALAIMYLDADTSFSVVNHEKAEEMIAMITYSKRKNIEDAHVIFVPYHSQGKLSETINNAKEGTLINPHIGATIIVECESCVSGEKYRCKGPGIENEVFIHLDVACDWLDARNNKNSEFPLGVDMIFVDGNYNLLALPRTTQIERVK